MPWPLTTSVPEKTHGVPSPPGAPISRVAPAPQPALRTGTDSPVSSDSSTARSHAVEQHGVGGDAIALGEQQHVAAHHLAPGDAHRLAVADDERARAGEVAQGLEGALGLALLVERDADDDDTNPNRSATRPTWLAPGSA